MDHNGETVDTVQVPAARSRYQQATAPPRAVLRSEVSMREGPVSRHGAALRDTRSRAYTGLLEQRAGAGWKRALNVQAPYRWNVRRLRLGRTLDVGCGIGRNLEHLDGNGVGVDHNPASVDAARARGLVAWTPAQFRASGHARPGSFDSLLVAHVLEHLPENAARDLVRSYLPYVRAGGRAVLITPQRRGFRSDPSHVRFVGFAELARLVDELGLRPERRYSFPLPLLAGRLFTHNEFVAIARVPPGLN